MSASRRRVRVARSLALRRPRHSLVFTLLGILLGALTVGTAAIAASARDAITESAAANLGGRSFVLETDDADTQKVLAGLDGASPIHDSSGHLTTDAGSLDVTLRITDDPTLVLGTLVAGTPTEGLGETLVSRSLAQALHVSVGDDVVVDQGGGSPITARVTGIIANTADAGARTIQLIGDPPAVASANRWVSDQDFAATPELEPSLSGFTAVTASRKVIEEAALENLPPAVSALTYSPVGSAVILIVLIASVAAALARTWSRDVEALTAAGLPAARGWRTIATTITGLLLTGILFGTGLTLGVVCIARSSISGALGQDWATISPPLVTLAVLPVAILVLGSVAVPLSKRLSGLRPRTTTVFAARPRCITPLTALVTAVAALILAYALWPRDSAGDLRALALVAAVALIAVLPFLLSAIAGAGLPRATRRLAETITSSFAAVCAVSAVIAFGTSTWAAIEFTDAARGESASTNATQPPGSLLVSAMPNSAIEQLHQKYQQLGGASVTTYELTSDAGAVWRATSPAAVACGHQGGLTINAVMECGEFFPIALDAPGTPTRATPVLTENGTVGLIAINTSDGTLDHASVMDATPDDTLGSLLPGIILSTDDPTVTELRIHGSGLSLVILEDFDTLPVLDRLAMRSHVLTLSPTANLSDATLPTAYDQIRATATGVALAGAAVATLVLLIGGGAIILAQDSTRRALIDIGLAPSLRAGIVARWAALPVLSLALAAILTPGIALAGPAASLDAFSWPSTIAYTLGLLTALALARAYLQPPQQSIE